MVLNALVLSHHLCELRCYRQLPFRFLFSLFLLFISGRDCFQLRCHPVMATASTTVPAQQPLLLGEGDNGRMGSWVEKEDKQCNFTNK